MHRGCALVRAPGLWVITIWIQRGSVSHDCVCVWEREICFNRLQIITVLSSRTQLKPHFLWQALRENSLFLTGANLVSKRTSCCIKGGYIYPVLKIYWILDFSFSHADYRGVDPGKGLCAAVSTGYLSDPVPRWLPQYEKNWKPPAPLCGVGWCQGKNPASSTRAVSVIWL